MTTKPNPFLAGMRPTGKGAFEKQEDRKEYEAGFMAINDLIDNLEAFEAMLLGNQPDSRERVNAEIADIDAAWSRIKAALASEVKP